MQSDSDQIHSWQYFLQSSKRCLGQTYAGYNVRDCLCLCWNNHRFFKILFQNNLAWKQFPQYFRHHLAPGKNLLCSCIHGCFCADWKRQCPFATIISWKCWNALIVGSCAYTYLRWLNKEEEILTTVTAWYHSSSYLCSACDECVLCDSFLMKQKSPGPLIPFVLQSQLRKKQTLVAWRPSNMQVYLRDGSAQTILRAATLR